MIHLDNEARFTVYIHTIKKKKRKSWEKASTLLRCRFKNWEISLLKKAKQYEKMKDKH